MNESYKSPDERVQMFEFPASRQIEDTLVNAAEENDFRVFGKPEFEKISKNALSVGNPMVFATTLINEIETSDNSRMTTQWLRQLRLKKQISDDEFVFAHKHRFRKGLQEARIILDTIIVDPASSKWGHHVISEVEAQFLSR